MVEKTTKLKKEKDNCGNCHYLTEPFLMDGVLKPCNQRKINVEKGFQKEDSPICLNFQRKFLYFKTDDLKTRIKDHLVKVIISEFDSEQDAYLVSTEIGRYLNENNLSAEFNQKELVNDVSKFAKLKRKQSLCHLFGLGRYLDQIMAAEIAKAYNMQISSLPEHDSVNPRIPTYWVKQNKIRKTKKKKIKPIKNTQGKK